MSGFKIEIEGLDEFRKAVKQLEALDNKMVKEAGNKAADAVIDRAAPQFPRQTGKARSSIRSGSSQRVIKVKLGSAKAKHAPWLDFGGNVGKNKSVNRKFIKNGRYLYPTYFKLRDSGAIAEILGDELYNAAKQAGLDVERG